MKKNEKRQKKKNVKPDDKEESTRFLKKAEEIQADDGKERFEKACGVILKKKG